MLSFCSCLIRFYLLAEHNCLCLCIDTCYFLTMSFSCFCSVQISKVLLIDEVVDPLASAAIFVSLNMHVLPPDSLPTCVAVSATVTMHFKCVQFQFVCASVSCCLCKSVCDFFLCR